MLAVGATTCWTSLAVAGDDAAPAPSETASQASARFKRGVEFFRDNDYEPALSEFRRAYALQPSYRVLYNIGQCALALHDYASALTAFEEYLRDGSGDVPDDRRALVELDLTRLRDRVGTLLVSVDEPGADVLLDEAPLGRSPLATPVRVNPGRHRIAVGLAGLAPQVRALDVAARDRVAVAFVLRRPPTPPPRAPVAVVAEHKSRNLWVAWASTGVLAAGAVTAGVVAFNARDAAKRDISVVNPDQNALQSHRATMRTSSVVADIVGAAAILAGATTLYITLRPVESPRAQPSVAFGPRSIQLTWIIE